MLTYSRPERIIAKRSRRPSKAAMTNPIRPKTLKPRNWVLLYTTMPSNDEPLIYAAIMPPRADR